ncbi:MAG: hypothetical protein WC184_01770 [Acidimicrobiia bacterium]
MGSHESRLTGRLDELDIASVLQSLLDAGNPGALVLRGEQRGVMVVEPPYINLVTTAEERLGADLVSAELVDEETWLSALSNGGNRPGGALVALVEAGVDHGAMREVLYEHVITALFELLVPGDTEFEFLPGVSHRLAIDPGFLYEDVLSDLNTRVGEWRQIAEAIPDTQSEFRRAKTLPADMPSVTLNRAEYELLLLIDTQVSVAELIAVSERPAFEVITQLYGLLRRGLLETKEP